MTTITQGQYPLLVSYLGAPNPLPIFRWQQPTALQQTPPSSRLSPADVEGAFVWGKDSILPYQVQDEYDRSQEQGAIDAIFVENPYLKLTLYPQYGGRLASIVHKEDGRELLFNNLVFQPANLAALNAWFSGGIEWNGLIPGHSPFTCSPVFAAQIDTENGPILRLYEFDRIREAAWQVDIFLPEDEDRLWVHVSITNPNPQAIKCYWWTNMAAPLERETRVLSPTDYSIEHVLPDNHLAPFEFPSAHGFDGSYPINYRDSASVFFRRPGQARPWIAAFQADGAGLFHTSTDTLQGRKLFTWGDNAGGRRWMDFLSLPGQGAYIELQAGVTPTQNQEFMLGAGQILGWTECIGPVEIEPQIGHDPNYVVACQAMEEIIVASVPEDLLIERDGWMAKEAVKPVDKVFQTGRAWGMLYEEMRGEIIHPGLLFDTTPNEEACWAELLEQGSFSPDSLEKNPRSWAVSERWVGVLERSADVHGTNWLHELFLGVACLDRENRGQAKEHFVRSKSLRANYLADRHLALIYAEEGDIDAAWSRYQDAWANSEMNKHLAVEICQFLQRQGMSEELATFLDIVPEDMRQHERIRLAQTEVALQRGDYQHVCEILDGHFATNREGETLLTDLWFAVHVGEAEKVKGSPLTPAEAVAVKAQNPPPSRIDFRMKIELEA